MINHRFIYVVALLLCQLPLFAAPTMAHHVLGRPSYSLNEDSNTPSSLQMETQIGDYFVTMMAFPAFLRPGTPGNIKLYATHLDTGVAYTGRVRFTVRDDSWFSSNQERLGIQETPKSHDDNIFRQGVVFSEEGDYIISAEFTADNEPYLIDLPLRVGNPLPVLSLSLGAAIIVIVLSTVFFKKRLRRRRRKKES